MLESIIEEVSKNCTLSRIFRCVYDPHRKIDLSSRLKRSGSIGVDSGWHDRRGVRSFGTVSRVMRRKCQRYLFQRSETAMSGVGTKKALIDAAVFELSEMITVFRKASKYFSQSSRVGDKSMC